MHQARMMRRWGLGRSRREGWEFCGWVLFMDGGMIQEIMGGKGGEARGLACRGARFFDSASLRSE